MLRGLFPSLGLASRRSLSSRGQRLNTFAGMGFSIAVSLLAIGGYLLAQQFTDSKQPQSLDLPLAALLITTALTLLYCLLHPWRKLPHDIDELPAIYWEQNNVAVIRSDARDRRPVNMPVGRRYVDRARIQIRR